MREQRYEAFALRRYRYSAVARMQRSGIRRTLPDFASLHPGYRLWNRSAVARMQRSGIRGDTAS